MGNYFTAAIVESLTFQNNKRRKRFGELYTKKIKNVHNNDAVLYI